MGLVDKIKNDVKKSGTNKGKLFFVREGAKARVRFLQDMDDGYEFKFHDSFAKGINAVCREEFGEPCPYCDDDDLRTRSMYAWSVWDYEAKEVKVFLFAVNNCSPVPSLMSMYDNYGILTDRDYVLSVQGKQTNKTYSVVPMDKVRFRNDKAKPLSKKAILKILNKAFPLDDDATIDDDDNDDESTSDYEGMSAKELYNMCKDRDIDCQPKKKEKYYINLLEEDDKTNDDWSDDQTDYAAMDEEDDDSGIGPDPDDEDDTPDYESMTPKELYKICKDKNLDPEPKQPKGYYVGLLEDEDSWGADEDDWGDDDE